MEQDDNIFQYRNSFLAIMDNGKNPDATKKIPDVLQHVKEFLDNYNGNIPLNFAIVSTKESIYGDDAEAKGFVEFQAAMHRTKGLVVLNASRLHSKDDCIESLRHEVLGHYGLLTFKPEEKIELLNEVIKTRNEPALKEIWATVDANYKHLNDWDYAQYHKAEEVFSFVAQKPELFLDNCWHKVRAVCTKILRKCGLISQNMTASELRVEALKISEGLRKGEREQQIFPENERILFKKALEQDYAPAKEKKSPIKETAIRDTAMSQAESFMPEAQINEECTVKPTQQRDLNAPGALGDFPSPEEGKPAEKTKGLPEFVQRNFLEVNGDFYFQNREPAFSFKNDQLKTKSTSPEVVKAFVSIAKEQQWSALTVTGNKEFRRAVWLEAASQGIEVNGYTPTEVEKAQAARLAEKNKSAENTVSEDKTRQAEEEQRRSMSEASRDNALNDAREKAQAFRTGEKADVLKQYPELAKAYGTVAVAEKFAKKNFSPEQAKIFVQKVQESYAEKIEKAEPLPAPTVKRSAVVQFLDRLIKKQPERPAPTGQSQEQPERPAPTVQGQEQPERPAPTVEKQGDTKVAQYIVNRGDEGRSAFDAVFSSSYLAGNNTGQTFVQMLEQGGMPKERAILVAEVSKVKEGLAPQAFAKEMAENKRMFDNLAKEPLQEKCRVLAAMYNERMENLRYNEKGEINHDVSNALYNRQNKIREGLQQRQEKQMIDAAKRPAPGAQSPGLPGNPSQRVNLEDRKQFVDYLQKAGVDAQQATKLFEERQSRKITDERTYAKEIAYERQQIAQMQGLAPSEAKAQAINKFVAENIQRNSEATKNRETQEQEKFVSLLRKNGISEDKAQVIYEARKLQKELDPEAFAHNKQLQQNVVGQCKAAKLSQADTEKRIAGLLENQYEWMKERASRDPAAKEIISRAEAGRMQDIRQERAQQRSPQERQIQEPQTRNRANSRGRDDGR